VAACRPLPAPARGTLANHAATITTTAPGKTAALAVAELRRGLARMGATPGTNTPGQNKRAA
jgi:hypothetical protein